MLCMPGKIKTDLLESFTTQSQSNFPNRLQMSFHNRFEVHKGPFHHHHKWVGVLFRLSFELFSFQVIPSPCFLFHFIVLLQKWGQSSQVWLLVLSLTSYLLPISCKLWRPH
jgi:hypothetical protein